MRKFLYAGAGLIAGGLMLSGAAPAQADVASPNRNTEGTCCGTARTGGTMHDPLHDLFHSQDLLSPHSVGTPHSWYLQHNTTVTQNNLSPQNTIPGAPNNIPPLQNIPGAQDNPSPLFNNTGIQNNDWLPQYNDTPGLQNNDWLPQYNDTPGLQNNDLVPQQNDLVPQQNTPGLQNNDLVPQQNLPGAQNNPIPALPAANQPAAITALPVLTWVGPVAGENPLDHVLSQAHDLHQANPIGIDLIDHPPLLDLGQGGRRFLPTGSNQDDCPPELRRNIRESREESTIPGGLPAAGLTRSLPLLGGFSVVGGLLPDGITNVSALGGARYERPTSTPVGQVAEASDPAPATSPYGAPARPGLAPATAPAVAPSKAAPASVAPYSKGNGPRTLEKPIGSTLGR
ncbi:hypothetical protein [Actinoplanes regularis]|uniref:Uncharacterized protein n=1 Tax=Actinoplanes regularis TaxID=52697 RepID=A0A239G5U6_9ACTN|nr:hypothetical protein [Actinoplanes regularis]GIE90433.1 hypothetical protein Are01nite_69130 [Actinoplanes regularis]SNS64519.1 hypothetical protein SAMN06264365_12041 [Actinoplanes regularis]